MMSQEEFQTEVFRKLDLLEKNQALAEAGRQEIKTAICGNHEFGTPGLVKDFHDHVAEDKVQFQTGRDGVNELKMWQAKVIGACAVGLILFELVFKNLVK